MSTIPELTIADDFPPVDYDTWRATVEEDLKGAPFERKLVSHTYEGIDIQPVYTLRDDLGEDAAGMPGFAPFLRGPHPQGKVMCGVDLRQEHAHPDIKAANKSIIGDLEGGVTSLVLRLDRAARNGFGVDDPQYAHLGGDDGVMVGGVEDLDATLAGVHLDLLDVAIDAGAAFLPAAATLAAVWKKRGIATEKARGAFNADPLATLARDGELPVAPERALEDMAALAAWTSENFPNVTSVVVDTSPYHDSGATAAQDIAMAMATAVEYLRAMVAAGMSTEDAARQIYFRMSLGTHHFLAIAKIRAARMLWSRVLEASGCSPVGMRIHARTSNRVMTQRDPYVNLLRNSVSMFAAIVGGVDSVTSLPFDHASRLPDDFSRRIARNTVLVLQEESHLHRVLDPAGGSWFLEKLTRDVAEKGWEVFQEIERKGGMLAALMSDLIRNQLDTAYAPRAKDIATRKEGITGVSEFPNLTEQRVESVPPDLDALRSESATRLAARDKSGVALEQLAGISSRVEMAFEAAAMGATISQIADALGFEEEATTIPPIEPHAFAQPFEELRDASDRWMEKTGHRPRIFLANIGPVAHFTARATFSKNFFEAGGFDTIASESCADEAAAAAAFKASEANIAVICSSDKLYADKAAPVAQALKAAGARTVILAGFPGANEETWREAGVDRFIFMKCDVLGTLRELLAQEGVL
ncbi:methylmalonyl-CoA mutase family protein [Aporhodopirellula aestuarii]|uniref:methylmalonyl-CoA mutase n=1 Tax=Aporhodopirellula aestuarii TaxID=2950107 RepID=A0ABT0U4Z1_9BACT|nr:methylmalonyl-CoA mutase family protein [Aporhodopirellula aestuarii]MCM2372004.1 methylmalonyl-CoA mutase subunit beta [Aporhodopirellula aestuarii]